MQKENARQILISVLRYKKRIPNLLKSFKDLLSNPEGKMREFLPLYEFVLFYNRCFVYDSLQVFEKILTKTELESANFQEFEKIFQNRQILDSLPEDLRGKDSSADFSVEERCIGASFLLNISFLFKNSSYGRFFQNEVRNDSIQDSLHTSFFSVMASQDYNVFKQRVQHFDFYYNQCLVESLRFWDSRQKILHLFFTLKNCAMSRFSLLNSLFYLDQKLAHYLASLQAFNSLSDQVRELEVCLCAKEKQASEKNSEAELRYKEMLDFLKKKPLTAFLPLLKKND